MTGLPWFGPYNEYKVVLFADFRKAPHPPPYEQHGRASAAAINTLHNVYVAKQLIQLTIDLKVEIIDTSHWSKDLT